MKKNSACLSLFIIATMLAFSANARHSVEHLMDNSTKVEQQQQAEDNHVRDKQVVIRAGHARALAAIADEKYREFDYKMVVVKVEKLTDNQGRSYLAGVIQRADIEQYLNQMHIILADDYQAYRQQQSSRDHGLFHLTLVNPFEYQALADKNAVINLHVRVQLHGLGRVSQGENTSYFVVASSSDGQFLRQNLLLPAKDFHVTLGFEHQDVHGVDKGQQTLIQSQ